MKIQVRRLAPALAALFFLTTRAQWANAQITNPIRAHVDHSFVMGDKTLPPGEYTFRMTDNSDQSLMVASSENGKAAPQFPVRQSVDDHRPNHSELVFRRYGNTEFLSKIYEAGSRNGVSVTETSKQEARLVSQGQHGLEHAKSNRKPRRKL